jgi:glyoxylase-like metal-dependent hydrolase (beta-lactamase superfamily II)/rhodanese-related sulfurtransferase
MSDPHETAAKVPSLEVAEVLGRLDRGDDVVILDVRNDDEFRHWKLEGRRPAATVHVPYFDFIEDASAAMAKVPRGKDLVALCAQGGSSEMIVEMLQEAGIPARNVKGGMVAYGEYLQPVRVGVPEETPFELWQFNRRGKGCLSYVVVSGREAVVVDPSRHVERYLDFVRGKGARVVRVLDTHVHADHVSGGPALSARAGAPYFVSAGEGFELALPVTPLRDGDVIRLDGGATVEVRLLATPGHTPGSTSFLLGGRYLLSGDTLFVSSVGRPDLGGHVVEWGRALFHTLHERIAALPDDTVVLPAHYAGPSEIGPDGLVAATLGDLRRAVPEMQMATEEEFVAAVREAVTTPPDAYAEIIKVNLGQARPPEDKITEWELGKNQCAVSARKAPAPAAPWPAAPRAAR